MNRDAQVRGDRISHAARVQVRSLLAETDCEPTGVASDNYRGLPNDAYWSPAWLEAEYRTVFSDGWVFAAATAELPATGSIHPVQVAGMPIILVRDHENKVRAFHNFCRHRGTRLIAESCRVDSISCPYHAWNYRLDGSLRARPHFLGANRFERIEQGSMPEASLLPVRTEIWNDCIFLNPSGNADTLASWIEPLDAVPRDLSCIRWIGKQSYRVSCNWKLVIENWMEGYHVFCAHPRLLEHAPMHVRGSGTWTGGFYQNGYLAPEVSEGRGDGALPGFPGLDVEQRRRGDWYVCFPNFCVEIYADQFVVLATTPLGPDETLEELHFFVAGDSAAYDESHAGGRRELMEMWRELNGEDINILENLQQGRRSHKFPGSYFSPAWEEPCRQFQCMIHETVQNGISEAV